MTTTACPLPIPPAAPQMRPPTAPSLPLTAPRRSGAWRYACPRRSRLAVTLAVLVSVGLHAGIIFGLGGRKKIAAPAPAKNLLALTFTLPKLEELDEPDPRPPTKPPPNPTSVNPRRCRPTCRRFQLRPTLCSRLISRPSLNAPTSAP